MFTLFGNVHKNIFLAVNLAALLSVSWIVSAFAVSPPKAFNGVCPPFFIRDESGAIINPVSMQNTNKPYSPKQTCGLAGCHNYKKITKGYHFQQGKDEQPSQKLKDLYQWVLSPGQYGGRW